jgi:sarcosine oxidase
MSGPQLAIIGLGATGSAAIFQLARRGVSATGFEQFAIGHDRGSSHGPTRIIRLAHFENASYVPLMRRAYALWRELEHDADEKLLHLTGIAEIGPTDGIIIQGTIAAARKYALEPEIVDARDLMRRYPAFDIPTNYKAVLQTDGGYIEAAKAIAANIRVAAGGGAIIRTGEKVLQIEARVDNVRIITDREDYKFDGVIIATGPWLRDLVPALRLPLQVTRQVVAWFEPDDVAKFTPEVFPVFILESRYGNHYGFPAYGKSGVKFAKHHHRQEIVEPDHYERRVSGADEAAIRAPLEEFLPGANGRLLSAQTCLYTMTPDDTFIVDRIPGFPHIVIASPCCGHGFKFSPVIGEIVADLVTEQTTDFDISQFRLSRFA